MLVLYFYLNHLASLNQISDRYLLCLVAAPAAAGSAPSKSAVMHFTMVDVACLPCLPSQYIAEDICMLYTLLGIPHLSAPLSRNLQLSIG